MHVRMKKVLSLALTFALAVSTVLTGIPAKVAKAAETKTGFVKTNGTKFTLDGSDFYYCGTNNYYINFKPKENVDELMKDAKDMGITVIRTWGNLDVGTKLEGEVDTDGHQMFEGSVDGPGQKDGIYFQYWDAEKGKPVLNEGEDGVQKLDYAIAAAEKNGIKLIITFTNYWQAFGGMQQYLAWAGLSHNGDTDVQNNFYTNETVKGWYKDYVYNLLNHTNKFTGRKLKDEPGVFAWELANEPRYNAQNSNVADNAMYNWVKEMSEYVKSVDTNHMVAVGDEGGMYYDGYNRAGSYPFPEGEATETNFIWKGGMGNYEHLMDIPTVDFGTPHLYVGAWSMQSDAELESWLKLHAQVAHAKNKPVILEEFGWGPKEPNTQVSQYAEGRDKFFTYIYKKVLEYDYAGSNFWMLAARTIDDAVGYYPDYDGFTVWNYDGPLSSDGVNRYGTNALIKAHAEIMNSKGDRNKISDTELSYDKKTPTTCGTTVTPQTGSEISSVSLDGSTLTKDTGYTVSNNVITFVNDYLNNMEEGTYYGTIHMTAGTALSFTLEVKDSSIVSAVAGTGPFTFDKNPNVSKNVTIPVQVNGGGDLKGVSVVNADKTKTALASDYYETTLSGVVIKANYLAGLDTGDVNFVLDYTKGTDPTVTVTIKDTTGKDILDNFESYADDSALRSAWTGPGDGGTVTASLVTKNGSKAMQYSYTLDEYAGLKRSATSLPVKGFDGISMWIQAPADAAKGFTLQIVEPASDYKNIYWEYNTTFDKLKAADGAIVKIPFADFEAKTDSWAAQPAEGQQCGDNSIVECNIYVGGSDSTGTFYVDDIKVYSEGDSDLTPVDVTDVSLNKSTLSVEAGKTATLTATVLPANATFKTVKWESSDSTVATVSNGTVRGVKAGETTITCTSTSNPAKKATCTVTVTEDTTGGSTGGSTGGTETDDSQIPDGGTINYTVSKTFDSTSEYDKIEETDPESDNEYRISLPTSVIPDENCKITFDMLLPASAGQPNYSNVIKATAAMLLGDNQTRVQQADKDGVDILADKFTSKVKINGTVYYKAPVTLVFGEKVSANVGSEWEKNLDFKDCVKEKMTKCVIILSGWKCNYSGSISVANVKFEQGTGHVDFEDKINNDIKDGTTGAPNSTAVPGTKENGVPLFNATKIIEDFSTSLADNNKDWVGETGYQYSAGKDIPNMKDGVPAEKAEITLSDGKLWMLVDYTKDLSQSWSEVKSRVYYNEGVDISGYDTLAFDLYYPSIMGTSIRTSMYAKNTGEDGKNVIIDQEGDLRTLTVKDAGNGWSCATVVATLSDDELPLQYLSLGIAGPYANLAQVYYDNVRVAKINPEIDYVRITETVSSNPGTPDVSKMPTSVKLVAGNPTQSTKALAAYMRGLQADDKVLFGHQNSIFRSVKTNGKTSDIYEITGNDAGVCGIDTLALMGKETGMTTASEALAESVRVAKKAAAAGSIVTLSCHMPNFGCDKITKNSDGTYNFTQCDFAESKLLTPADCADEVLDGGKYNAQFTAYLDIIADFAKQLDEDNIPVLFRPFHENTGNWFWWGTGITADSYKAMWRYMVDYLESKGVNNFLYIYSPNGPISSVEEYGARYPGDQYVDIVAFDYYNDYASLTEYNVDAFFDTMNASCAIVNEFAKAHDKIPAIAETGIRITAAGKDSLMISGNPTKDADWYNRVIDVAKDNDMPYFLLWANFSSSNFFVPYKFNDTYGQEMINDFIKAYNNTDSIFANANKTKFYTEAVAKNITATSYAGEVTGYLVEPKNFAAIKTATTLKAYIRNGDKTTVKFGVKASKTGEETYLTATRSGSTNNYTANLDSTTLKSLGTTGTGVVTVYAGDTAIGSAQFINFNQDAKVINPPYFDDYETYYGDSELMVSKYGSDNHAAGCASSVSLSTHRNDGDYGMKFHYTLKYQGSEVWTGGYGHTLTATDWSEYNGLSLWIKPDGHGQKLVLQLVDSTGTEYEYSLSEITKTTKAQVVTIPFSKIVSKKDATVSVPADNIAAFKIWCNSIPENYKGQKDSTGGYTVTSDIYLDDIQAVKTAGSTVTNTPEDDKYQPGEIDEATQNVIDLIDSIGTVENTTACKAKIDAAREAYDALTTAQKELVTNLEILEAAEAAYEELQKGEETDPDQEAADKAAAQEVVNLIHAIDEVDKTDLNAYQKAISATKEKYNALTAAQKTLVSVEMLDKLVAAEADYAQKKLEAENASAQEEDKAAAQDVVDLINDIGVVKYPDSEKKINAADTAYNALSANAKVLISEELLYKLAAAKADYAQLKLKAEQDSSIAEADQKAADNVVELIRRIGNVSYPGSKEDIEAARKAYDSLTKEQKALISAEILSLLTKAEKSYADLKEKAEGSASTDESVAAAEVLINRIGTVTYPDSKRAIDAARKAYNALTTVQQAKVSDTAYNKLLSAEKTYAALKAAADKAAADKAAAAKKEQAAKEEAAKKEAEKKAVGLSLAESDATITNIDTKDAADSTFAKLQLKGVAKSKTSVKLTWKKVSGANGYIIYGAASGKKNKMQLVADVTGSSYTVKGLKAGKSYKYVVRAYKLVHGDKRIMEVSKTIHVTTKGGKYGNPTSITNVKSRVNVKKGKKLTLKPRMKVSKKIKNRITKFRYESSNKSIATVSSKGKITAKKKGSCTVYIYTQNGCCKKVKVKVK